MLCLCVLLYPEGLQGIEIIKRKVEDYLLSIISPPKRSIGMGLTEGLFLITGFSKEPQEKMKHTGDRSKVP